MDDRSAFDMVATDSPVAVPLTLSAPVTEPPPRRRPRTPPQSRRTPLEEDESRFVDEFGFVLDDDSRQREEVYVRSVDGQRVVRREVKWVGMTQDWGRTLEEAPDKVKDRCRKGIPPRLRGVSWQMLCGSRVRMDSAANAGVYVALKAKTIDADTVGVIERDLGRTFPTHVSFRDTDSRGQTLLRNILHAYAAIDPEVGYVQGMGFIVGTLLTQMEEEEAFWALHVMMHSARYNLRELFKPGFPLLQQLFFQLRHLCEAHIPKLQAHLDALGIDPSFFAAQWFLTLFVYHFQFRAVLRIWDIFLCEGWKIIFRVAVAMMKWDEKRLRSLQFEQLLPALKSLHELKNPDEILTRALGVKFKTSDLVALRDKYHAQRGSRVLQRDV